MAKALSLVVALLLLACVANAQPQVAYITPDAGAPGMCVVIEIVAPTSATTVFGPDSPFMPSSLPDSLVQFVRATDNALIRLGPAEVSWDGREISQMIFIEPNIPTLDTSVQLVVFYNNQKSAPFAFHIVKPRHIVVLGGVIGTSPANLRSARNTLVVDSLILQGGTYTFDKSDIDPSTPGNQGYLPVRILSQGPIRISNNAILNVSGNNGSTTNVGGSGGPGGGGGGAGYTGKGGDGYTGGGGNSDGSSGPGGVGSGSTNGNNSYDGGKSLNGVAGGSGEQHPGSGSAGSDDGGGGGTGHPFGTSGVSGGIGSPPGGYGGGSAGGSTGAPYATNYGGGGGGYFATGGGGVNGPADSGRSHGNRMLVPLAGGSGGGAGNDTYVPTFGPAKGGCGGGGGGAVELTSFTTIDIENSSIAANGGNGSNAVQSGFGTAAGGGGGSGGAIALDARDSIDFSSNSSTSITGGSAGTGQNGGGPGGLGRVRINGYVSKVNGNVSSAAYFASAKDYTGPSIQKVIVYKDSLIVIGHARYWDGIPGTPLGVDVRWQWSGTSIWNSCTNNQPWCPSLIVDPASHTAMWRDTIPISQAPTDTEIYIVAVQGETAVSQTKFDVPPEVMSHTSGIIMAVPGAPKASIKPDTIDFGNIRVGNCSRDTTIVVSSIGKAELAITSITLSGPDKGQFTLKTSAPPSLYVKPGQSTAITVQFCPTQMKCPMNATLHIVTNDISFDIALIGCGVSPQASIYPTLLNFGLVRIGDCKDSFVTITNTGSDTLTITQESIGDPVHFKVLDQLPLTVAPTKSLQLQLQFCPSVVPLDTNSDVILSDAEQGSLTVKLVGGGKQGVLSIPTILDFGEVAFDSCKDSSIDLKNIGTDAITIAAENLIVPINFHFVSPTLPVSIAPGASVPFVFQFCSKDTGSFSAIDTVFADASSTIRLGGVTLLAHTGYGILSTLTTIDFGGVVVGGCKDTIITIQNIGKGQLIVDSIPNLPAEFSVQSGLPVSLAPDQSAPITLRYCPSGTTTTTAMTIIVVDTPSKNSPLTLEGNGLEGALSTSDRSVDLGCVRQGSSVTKSIRVQNTGSGALNGIGVAVQPSGALTIVHAPQSTLSVGASDSIVLVLTASQLGDVNASVVLLWTGGGPLSLPVTAHVAVPPTLATLDSVVAFDSVTIGDSSVVKCIRIMNPSCAPLTVDSLVVANSTAIQYSIVSTDLPKLPAMISDSQVWNVCVRYKALRADTSSAALIIKSGGSSYIAGHLTGIGKSLPTAVQLTMDTVYGRPGETVNLHVRTINDVTTAGITSVTFRLQFDPMQLDMKTPVAPITSSIQSAQGSATAYTVKRYSLGDQEVTATYPSALAGKAIIASVPFEILLPSASTAKVHLLNATFGKSLATLSTASDGQIAIEQCDTNERITMGMQPVAVAQNNPNPFNPRTSIHIDMNEAGHVVVELYNTLGQPVLKAFDEDVQPGVKQVEIDADALPSGAYRYITSWSNGVQTMRDLKTMVVVK